jgi:hypothetical protein
LLLFLFRYLIGPFRPLLAPHVLVGRNLDLSISFQKQNQVIYLFLLFDSLIKRDSASALDLDSFDLLFNLL